MKQAMRPPLLIGLTGGIGSGKSSVAELFAGLGARIIDTDLLSRQLTASGGEAIPAIREAFGEAVIAADGSLERSRMRERVFAREEDRHRLEAILHPLILQQARKLAGQADPAPYTLLVVPLLFESQMYRDWLHRVVVVDCAEEQQIARVLKRSGLDRDMVLRIMAQQLARQERLSLADDVIHNDGPLSGLPQQVAGLHTRYLELSAGND